MKESKTDPRRRSGFSRREFLRGSGAAAAATALASGGGLVEAQQEPAEAAPVRGAKQITLQVNGEPRTVRAEPRMTLLEALRYQLGLTGAKPVSGDGTSGASTVLVDGKPMTASTLLAFDCVDLDIRTVEALGGDDPDEVPRAFAHADAMQCGFCTPGFVVAVRAFLDQHPRATEAEIRAGLNGNICRCGTYADVIEAALAVVKGGTNG